MSELQKLNAHQIKVENELLKIEEKTKLYKDQLLNAKKVISLVGKYNHNFEKIEKRLGDENSGVAALLEKSNATKDQLVEVLNSGQKILESIQSQQKESKSILEEQNRTYQEFNSLNEKIKDPSTGLNGVLYSSTEIKDKLSALEGQATESVVKIGELERSIIEKISQLDSTYTEFLRIKGEMDNESTGLLAILASSTKTRDEISAIKSQGDTIYTEISRIKDDSNNFFNDISLIIAKAKGSADKISEYEKDSEENKKKIEKIYKIATDSGLANSFEVRKKELYWGVGIWLIVLIVSAILLTGLLIYFHIEVFKDGNVKITNVFWYRLTLSFPLLFLVSFSAIQYSKERALLEKYAFKSATALALESYTTLLTSKFKDYEDKIVFFVLDSMQIIYREPYEKTKESKIAMSLGNQLAEIKTEISEKFEEFSEKKKETAEKPSKVINETNIVTQEEK